MEHPEIHDVGREIPNGLTPPTPVEPSAEAICLWAGKASLTHGSRREEGRAKVLLDTLPHPTVRFEFQSQSAMDEKATWRQFAELMRGNGLEAGVLECGQPIGKVDLHPTFVNGATWCGTVFGSVTEPVEQFTSGKFLVINGPIVRGEAVRRERSVFCGRLQAGKIDTGHVIVDRLSSVEQSRRSVFGLTHVAEIRFSSPQSIKQFEEVADILFRTLSLMRAGWVGLAGPWLYLDDELCAITPRVTKTSQNGGHQNWYPDTLLGIFEELFSCLQSSFNEPERGGALTTGLHWLIESQQCTGGVEGSLILQQAALEALAWFDIVQNRKICSACGFQVLPAADKIRWLSSLHSISVAIPPHCTDLVSYKNAYPPINDLPDILVDVRNALVHGTPKKVKRLFERSAGDDERTNLWWLITGLLEQIVLAIAGYRGKILRRDIDAKWAAGAVRQVPWA